MVLAKNAKQNESFVFVFILETDTTDCVVRNFGKNADYFSFVACSLLVGRLSITFFVDDNTHIDPAKIFHIIVTQRLCF